MSCAAGIISPATAGAASAVSPVGVVSVEVGAPSFTDVPAGWPFFTEIEWLAAEGISTGWVQPDGTAVFQPLEPVHRDAMAAFMYRLAGSPAYSPESTSPFGDVSTSSPFYKEISWLAKEEISTGWPDGTFRPLDSVNRDAMAAFMYRLAERPAFTTPATSPFADITPVTPFYREMSWLADQGISTGWPDRTFRPLNPVNRDAMAAFMYRLNPILNPARYPLRVSVATDGTQGNAYSNSQAISGDGQFITYASAASNLVHGDTNGNWDVFMWDRLSASTVRVSVATDGTQANDGSFVPAISADGRYITYSSNASNLVAGDTNGKSDVFVWDRNTGSTTRVSVATDGTQANNSSFVDAISADGRYITYSSYASNLLPGDTNEIMDVFVWDRDTASTTRVSVATDGTQANDHSFAPAISGDGSYITYESRASNLVAGDTNGNLPNVLLWDRGAGTTTRVSDATDGTQANGYSGAPAISGDGRYITYVSGKSNVDGTYVSQDVVVWDRDAGTTTRVSTATDGTQANGYSGIPAISADGRYITYTSGASNLVAGDTNEMMDMFVWDREAGSNARVSTAGWPFSEVVVADWNIPAISGDGRYITWDSNASNLVAGDTNGTRDVFVTLNPLLP